MFCRNLKTIYLHTNKQEYYLISYFHLSNPTCSFFCFYYSRIYLILKFYQSSFKNNCTLHAKIQQRLINFLQSHFYLAKIKKWGDSMPKVHIKNPLQNFKVNNNSANKC
ncbi:hypothetical protein EDEG_03275 [Edhazardia aedis USNM 41457]|uniref:Uncharacterized protein n=1 Tax=Edhazardia aedis (strain USNM 41457) TaxID=1003232 RepID=J9DLP5_EDHAE|nr:hypothetical protein EDEG_03275 [Edhazardia aedis USNM 41457]|eukprot:EJW02292.1 hypothetical protein EDEG_03275 [Edhazardia aedis USNM 41457]